MGSIGDKVAFRGAIIDIVQPPDVVLVLEGPEALSANGQVVTLVPADIDIDELGRSITSLGSEGVDTKLVICTDKGGERKQCAEDQEEKLRHGRGSMIIVSMWSSKRYMKSPCR